MTKRIHLIGFLVLLFTVAIGHLVQAQQIHVLMVSDTNDRTLGMACEATLAKTQQAFAYLVPNNQYSFQVLQNSTKQTIYQKIRDIPVNRNDTFVFLFHGHGGRENNHHFLHRPNGEKLWSANLDRAVNKKRCRFRAILTCSCNMPERVPVAQPKKEIEKWNVNRQGIAPVMEELFLRHTGFLHVNSAWGEQFSFSNVPQQRPLRGQAWGPHEGSIFFSTLFGYCTDTPTGRPTWESLDRMISRTTSNMFSQRWADRYRKRGQKDWYPVMWDVPNHIRHRTVRLGATGDDNFVRNGVLLTNVIQGSPATNITFTDNNGNRRAGSMREDDVLLSINGEPIRNEEDYSEFVDLSSSTMRFTFRRGKRVYNGKVTLGW